jgi:diguanylate cyclase (GGDEF)-like protein
MAAPIIAVLTQDQELLDRLRKACPGFRFEQGQPSATTQVVIVDGQPLLAEVPARIHVVAQAPARRVPGDLYITREKLLTMPEEFLLACMEVAVARDTTETLKDSLEFATQVQDLMSISNFEKLSERITGRSLEILGLPWGTLLIHDPQVERFVVSFSNDPDHRETDEFVPGIPTELLRRSLDPENFYALQVAAIDHGGMLAIPIQIHEDMIGILKFPIARGEKFEEEMAVRASEYVRAVTPVLANIYQLTKSKDLAMRDDLTKAFNRRFFDSHLDDEIERSRRYGSLLSIIFLDLDDLKHVNNHYGHLAGSRTLQEVAKRILGAVRGVDKVVRFGGDEFCIILPQTDPEQARAVANRVHKAVTDSAFRVEPNVEVRVTASFGIATFPVHALTKEDLIRQADSAMYKVKSTTKNSIGVASVISSPRTAVRQEG